jgi:hypothetical protein
LTPLIVGAVVAALVAFLLGFLYGPHSGTPLFYGVGAGLLAAYLGANLAGNRANRPASAQQKTQALEAPPPEGKARLYLYREGFVAKLAGLNIAVDGQVVAQLKSPQFTCITVRPGRHALTAAFGGLAGPQNTAAKLTIDLAEGGEAAVLMTVKMGLARNAIDMIAQPNVPGVKLSLASMAMAQPEAAEV